ncbi:hypothetical protein HMPREF0620_1540 [Parascardovia denticolens DSM 10105 = JCM 12538]|uniref:Uncharacterized protein n=1 Tax=Parascardovia denticolens DSM 10105 = JCM 12538 TaxID=864564 RepID=E6K267_PARDN|nr:hypothetical protein HMPREF0620_1540 [Parascardovia denticolens DSM 10105 = JCM 12538]BAR04662.1 hypothetical protein PSDT_0143 [Parascardovia denticolens DSM 10105 = JCM 12538]
MSAYVFYLRPAAGGEGDIKRAPEDGLADWSSSGAFLLVFTCCGAVEADRPGQACPGPVPAPACV